MVEVVPIIVIFVAEGCFSVFFAVVPNRFGIHPRQKCLGGRSIPKRGKKSSFWDLPHLEGPPGHINPKTIWNNARLPRKAAPRRCPRRRQGTPWRIRATLGNVRGGTASAVGPKRSEAIRQGVPAKPQGITKPAPGRVGFVEYCVRSRRTGAAGTAGKHAARQTRGRAAVSTRRFPLPAL